MNMHIVILPLKATSFTQNQCVLNIVRNHLQIQIRSIERWDLFEHDPFIGGYL